MVRLRLLVIGLVIWLIVLFNLSRPDLFLGGMDLTLSLSPVVYIIAGAIVMLILFLPDLGQIKLWALLIPLFIIYGFSRLVLTPINPLEPKHSLYYILTEMLILAGTVYSTRLVSLAISNFEKAVENVVAGPRESRVLPKAEGIEMINVELYRARMFNRTVGFIYVNITGLADLPKDRGPSPSLEIAFQRRYVQNQVAHIVETALYRSDIICWYNDGLLICLPETTYDFAVTCARRLGTLMKTHLSRSIPMGVASFPANGLITEDLLSFALRDQQIYQEVEKTFITTAAEPDDESENAVIVPDTDNDSDAGHLMPMMRSTAVPMMAHEGDSTLAAIRTNGNINPIMTRGTPMNAQNSRPPQPPSGAFSLRGGLGAATMSLNSILSIPSSFTDVLPTPGLPNPSRTVSNRPDDPDFWVNHLPYQSQTSRSAYRIVKRVFDLTLVIASAPVTLPVGLLVALLTYLDSGKPIFFKQERTGLGGHRFKMYKFRTMVPNAEEMLRELAARGLAKLDANGKLAAPLKLDKDPRITRVGRILRKTSLDELPQLINVLRGEMSIVGPRPTSWDLGSYSLQQTERLNAKPGITGLWQVYGRGTTDFSGWVKWDVMYFEKMSLSLDIQLIFLTVLQVLKRKGAR